MSTDQVDFVDTLANIQHTIVGVLISSFFLGVYSLLIAMSSYCLLQSGLYVRTRRAIFRISLVAYASAVTFFVVMSYSLVKDIFKPETVSSVTHANNTLDIVLTFFLGYNFMLSISIILYRILALWPLNLKIKIVTGVFYVLAISSYIISFSVALSHPRYQSTGNASFGVVVGQGFGIWAQMSTLAFHAWGMILISYQTWELYALRRAVGSPMSPLLKRCLLSMIVSGCIYLCILIPYVIVTSFIPSVPQAARTAFDAVVVPVSGIYDTIVIVLAFLQKINGADKDTGRNSDLQLSRCSFVVPSIAFLGQQQTEPGNASDSAITHSNSSINLEGIP